MKKVNYGLENKVIVVTGGTRGVGLEIVRNLLLEKAKVAICARKKDGLDAAVRELKGGDSLLAMPAHIAKEGEVEAFFNAVISKYHRIDVLINNVGMNILTGSITDTELKTWQKILDTNLTGTFLTSRKAARIMRDQHHGKIVNMSSVASMKASPGLGIYGIAKGGIEMLTRVMATELAPYNIQVNAVAPMMVRTHFSEPFWSNKDIYEHFIEHIPLRRIAEPMDVVHAVLFLASEATDYITGHTIVVDGGATAM